MSINSIKNLQKREPRKVEDSLAAVRKKHGDRYDYTETVFKRSIDKIAIRCRIHGIFWQTLNSHILGCGCPMCAKTERAKSKTTTHAEFVKRAIAVHGGVYTYPEEYTKAQHKLKIICPLHGEFLQSAIKHLQGKGCRKCATTKNSKKALDTLEDFVAKATAVHGDRYDYTLFEYTKSSIKSTILCREHGPFQQSPNGHLSGKGCQTCAGSNLENKIYEHLLTFGVPIVRRERSILKRKELDFYFPEQKLAVELNGVLWHSSFVLKQKGASWVRRHQLDKQNECKQLGIRLLHYYEDECRNKLSIVLNQIKTALGLNNSSVMARNTGVRVISSQEASKFLDTYHLQGKCKASTYLALYQNDYCVAVLAMAQVASHRGKGATETDWELVRYASKGRVVGGASKLLKAFLTYNKKCTTIISYSDNRWATGNMYTKLGFIKNAVTPPDYVYLDTRDNQLYHKSSFRREALAKKFPDKFDPSLSERENCHNLGFYQIFNCGLTKWRLDL